MPTLTLTLPRPHVSQRRILSETRRFNVVNCGRRFGKTTLGVNRLLGPALDGYPVGWFAPKYKMLLEAWRDFRRVLRPVTSSANFTEKRIELITGGVVDFWTLEDPDAGRSRKYKRVAIDEAAKTPNLEEAWTKAISPTLADFRGDADFYSTPRGRDFFWKCYARGEDPSEPEWRSWTMPTASNPFIAASEIESQRRQLPDRVFRQEFLAEFIEDAGGVFRCVADAIDAGRNQPTPPDPSRSYSLGVDLARVEDFTVLSGFDDRGVQVYFERFNQISWERQIETIKSVARRYRAKVYIDSTGVGDPIYEQVRKSGVSCEGVSLTNASKEAIMDNLAMSIEQGRIRLMDIPEQTNELYAYEYEITPSRKIRMNAPAGMHDDTVVACALGVWGVSKPKFEVF